MSHRTRSTPSTYLEALLKWLRSTRFSTGLFCPHCSGRRIQRWGRFSGRQRYRCGDCRRTFSDLTGTPAAYIKKLEKWPAYGLGMEQGESLRAAARRLGVHPSTAFRWRHRLLDGMRERDRERLAGWVELCVLSGFPESKKGQRGGLGRPARTHAAFPYAGPADRPPRSWVLVARDRQGHVVTGIVPRRTLGSAELERVLGDRLRASRSPPRRVPRSVPPAHDGSAWPPSVTGSDCTVPSVSSVSSVPSVTGTGARSPGPDARSPGPDAAVVPQAEETVLIVAQWRLRPLQRFADRVGAAVVCGWPAGRARHPLVHFEGARAYWFVLRSWMRRFRGVATRYLPNYLLWHRWLDRATRHASRHAILRWAQPLQAS